MRSVAGYVTNKNRKKRDRKEAQMGLNKNLKEENLNRLLISETCRCRCLREHFLHKGMQNMKDLALLIFPMSMRARDSARNPCAASAGEYGLRL